MLIWSLSEVSVCQINCRIIFFHSWLMLPVGWYFKTLNILFPHNLLPNGFSFLKFLFWVNILSILWVSCREFWSYPPLPQLLPYLLSSSHCSAVSFLFRFSFHWVPCMWANYSWGGDCPGLWATYGRGYCKKTDSPTHRSYQIASQLGMGLCACLPHPCWDLICFGNILPKSVISLRIKKMIIESVSPDHALTIFQHSCRMELC